MTPRVRSTLALGVLLLVVGSFYRQLLDPTGFRSRDHVDQYLRVHQYAQEIRNGHWPQTLPDALRGGGHAFPRFYPPLSHLTAAAIHLGGADVIVATHWSGFLAVLLSAAAMYWLLHRVTGSVLGAVIAVLAFAAFPYRFLQLYARGAFAEAWAFVWYPLVLLGGWIALQERRLPRWWPATLAGLLVSHTVMAAWTLPLLLALPLVAAPADERWRYAGRAAWCGALSVLLAGFYLLPLATGINSVRASEPGLMHATPAQLAGTIVAAPSVGPFPVTLIGLIVLLAAGVWGLRRGGDPVMRLLWVALLALVFLAGAIMAPEAVWRVVPQPLRFIQFPYRLLGPAGFLGAVAIGILAAFAIRTPVRWVWVGGVPLMAVLGWYAGSPVTAPRDLSYRMVMSQLQTDYPDRGFTIAGDFLPRGTEPLPLARSIQAALDSVGMGSLVSWTGAGGHYQALVRAGRDEVIRLPLVAYDFFRVSTSEGVSLRTESVAGQLGIRSPGGEHALVIDRRIPVPLALGAVLSLGGVLLLAFTPRSAAAAEI